MREYKYLVSFSVYFRVFTGLVVHTRGESADSVIYSKCCDLHQILDFKGDTCVQIERNLTEIKLIMKFRPNIGFPSCPDLVLITEKIFQVKNGSLVIDDFDTILSPDQYCIDSIIETDLQNSTKIQNQELKQVAIVCTTTAALASEPSHRQFQPEHTSRTWRLNTVAILLSVSAIFLFLTIAVHLLFWKRKNIHHWLQFSYIVALFFASVLLAFLQFASKQIWTVSCWQLTVIGVFNHFAILTVFSWLTSMNFDIWLTIGRSPLQTDPGRNYTKMKFFAYCVFSLGAPFIITASQFLLNTSASASGKLSNSNTNQNSATCKFFTSIQSQLLYMYGPITLMLLINCGLICTTMFSLYKETTAIGTGLNLSSSNPHKRKSLKLFIKLLVLMGICWIFEVLSWFTLTYFDYKTPFLIYFFFTTDCLIASKGIMIFIVFVCKEGLWKKLSNKIWNKFPEKASLQKTSSVTTTTSASTSTEA